MPDALHRLSPPGSPIAQPGYGWIEFSSRLAADSPLLKMLTRAEREVTMHLRLGLSNKEIAVALGKSPATVKAQVASILHKLEVPTRCRLIAWLHEQAERVLVS